MDSLRVTLIIIGALFIVLVYAWEKIKQRKHNARYARWGGVADDATETHVVGGYGRDQEIDSQLVATAYEPEPEPVKANPAPFPPAEDDVDEVPKLVDVVSPAAPGPVDEPVVVESSQPVSTVDDEVDLDADPELDTDPLNDITSELEALEEMIAGEPEEAGQLELGDLEVSGEAPESAGAEPERIIAVHVLAREGSRFQGPDILSALMHNNMQFGDMNIFHRLDSSGKTVFSLANAVEPGVFDMSGMDDFSTPALLFIMTLPNPAGALEAFDSMLEVARAVTDSLNGRLCDDKRSVLTRQAIDELRREITISH